VLIMLVCIAIVYIFNDSCGMSAIVNKRILYCIVFYRYKYEYIGLFSGTVLNVRKHIF